MAPSPRLRGLPLIETHAHLNGSIPASAIAELVKKKSKMKGNEDLMEFKLPSDADKFDIHDFFPLFGKFIYRLTDDAESITFATVAVLNYFDAEGCVYLELRTTPREVPSTGISFERYVEAVREGFRQYHALTPAGAEPRMMVKLLLSVDRRHSVETADQVVDLAIGNRDLVVGIDVCGDPTKGDARELVGTFRRAKEAGLKVTVHLGEIPSQLETQAADFLLQPDRLGHATYLSQETMDRIVADKIPIEICITSNLVCKTVPSLDKHHIAWALARDIPILICVSIIFSLESM
ncbi:hypothetical protein MNV49_007447 [Pseudohyphozyma bogoriensis]|nr:hypothetical protein MNV49_007447 [Pseudohyphozyma bogoriensis]